MCQGSVGCATSIPEFLSCWLFKRDAPHCGFVCSWDNKVMNGVASGEGICPHTHTLPPLLSPFSLTPNQSTHEVRVHTGLERCGGHAGREMCELWRSAEPLSRAVAIKQKRWQHERIPAIYKRKWKIRETMSEFCSPGWSVKPQVAAAAAAADCFSLLPPPHPQVKRPSHHHHVHLSHPTNCTSWPPLDSVSRWPARKICPPTLTSGFHCAILRGHQGLHFEPGSSREHSNRERFIWLSLQMSRSEIYC